MTWITKGGWKENAGAKLLMSDAMPELNECKFCASMGFGGCEMCTDSRSERDRLKSELERVKRENEAFKAFVLMKHGKSELDNLMDCLKQDAPE